MKGVILDRFISTNRMTDVVFYLELEENVSRI